MTDYGPTDRKFTAEEAALDRLWRRHGFGEPPFDHLTMKREFLNRIGVDDVEIERMISEEIARQDRIDAAHKAGGLKF